MKWKSENRTLKKYKVKRMQSEVYKKLYEENYRWLQSNIEPKKVVPIIAVQEHMVETKAWKANRGLPVESDKCRIWRTARKQ